MPDEQSAILEGEAVETDRLLQGTEQEPSPRTNMYTDPNFWIFVFSTVMISVGANSFFLAVPRLSKNVICCSYFEHICKSGFTLIPEKQCNTELVMDTLASVRFTYFTIQPAVAIIALLVWCPVVAFHCLRLRSVLILAQCGAIIAEVPQAYIFWSNGSLDLRWIWASPLLSALLGGGGMTYMVLRDCALRQMFGEGHFFSAQLLLGASANTAAFLGLPAASWVMQTFGEWYCLFMSFVTSILGCGALFFLSPLPEVDKPQSFKATFSFDLRTLIRTLIQTLTSIPVLSIPVFSIPAAFDYLAVYEYTVQYIPHRFKSTTPDAGWVITGAKLLPALATIPVACCAKDCSINVQLTMAAGLLLWQGMFSAMLAWSDSLALFGVMLAAASLGSLLPHFARALISSTSKSTQRTGIFVADQVAGLLFKLLSSLVMKNIIYDGNRTEPKQPGRPYFATAIVNIAALIGLCIIWGIHVRREHEHPQATSEPDPSHYEVAGASSDADI
ncbi:uncharacterized protein E0L32_000829 [Thyridium curvatum]|uniref:Uncharacterized protein n=1 Tax=Thyridium curvatum TaxID=1093900 RepID=A0A507ARM3_9PEZI|nr:uncharacterized protein E0L32_000829 [Thyridium curvatum]TPX12652.1 hypothetical protein E0L32_000829 [Thyridium curvatum]